MPLTPGTRLGPYEVGAQIGAGGMGEVYRAHDTNLKRSVAIKILPEALATDPERLARFQREAEVLASLNHPNIAHIYGLERLGPSGAEDVGIRGEGSASVRAHSPEPLRGAKAPSKRDGGGVPGARGEGGAPAPLGDANTIALVMELVEGPTLADVIARGAIPVDEALPIARQIAQALEAAHERGIIHRDLKPANVKVRPDGTVKVLDFGLAKALDTERSSAAAGSASQSPTITTPAMTHAGVILGTAAYMSPEQARGRPVDTRADIWAFGCVLYEMLTGTRAFEAEDVPATLAEVIKSEPAWRRLPGTTPPGIRAVLRRSLEKDVLHRLRDIGDARIEIDDFLSGRSPLDAGSAARAYTPGRMAAWVVVPVVAALVGGYVAGRVAPSQSVAPQAGRYLIPLEPGGELAGDVALSSDGRYVAYTLGRPGARQLYLKNLADNGARPIASSKTVTAPFFSQTRSGWDFSRVASCRRCPWAVGRQPSLPTCRPTGAGAGAMTDGSPIRPTVVPDSCESPKMAGPRSV